MKQLQVILLAVVAVLAAAGVFLLNGINTSLKEEAANCSYPLTTLQLTYNISGSSFDDAQQQYTAQKKKTLDILSEAGIVVKATHATTIASIARDIGAPADKDAGYNLEEDVDIDIDASDKMFDVLKKLSASDVQANLTSASNTDDCAKPATNAKE